MTDWYSAAREADGRTDEEIMAEIALRVKPCVGCQHPRPDPHVEREGGYWCEADMAAARAAGDDPRSVGPCW